MGLSVIGGSGSGESSVPDFLGLSRLTRKEAPMPGPVNYPGKKGEFIMVGTPNGVGTNYLSPLLTGPVGMSLSGAGRSFVSTPQSRSSTTLTMVSNSLDSNPQLNLVDSLAVVNMSGASTQPLYGSAYGPGIKYENGYWFSFAQNRPAYSTDYGAFCDAGNPLGATWTLLWPSMTDTAIDIIWNAAQGFWYAVISGDVGQGYHSTNLVNWTATTYSTFSASYQPMQMLLHNGVYYAWLTRRSTSSYPSYLFSCTDPRTQPWNQVYQTNNYSNTGQPRNVVVAPDGSIGYFTLAINPYYYRSANGGSSFSAISIGGQASALASAFGDGPTVHRLGNTIFVIYMGKAVGSVGYGTVISYSNDSGLTWTTRALSDNGDGNSSNFMATLMTANLDLGTTQIGNRLYIRCNDLNNNQLIVSNTTDDPATMELVPVGYLRNPANPSSSMIPIRAADSRPRIVTNIGPVSQIYYPLSGMWSVVSKVSTDVNVPINYSGGSTTAEIAAVVDVFS